MQKSNYVYLAVHEIGEDIFPKLKKLDSNIGYVQSNDVRFQGKSFIVFSNTFGLTILNGETVIIMDRTPKDSTIKYAVTKNRNTVAEFPIEDLIKEYRRVLELNSMNGILCLNLFSPYDIFELNL